MAVLGKETTLVIRGGLPELLVEKGPLRRVEVGLADRFAEGTLVGKAETPLMKAEGAKAETMLVPFSAFEVPEGLARENIEFLIPRCTRRAFPSHF